MKKYLLFIATFILVFNTGCAQKKSKAVVPAKKQDVTVVQIPENTTNANLLAAIEKPYKGKVVLIDFWATWCGPCMMAMKQIDPIKEKYLKDKKNVAFVYVTGETSPLENFNAAYPNIKGFHYRLTNAQFSALLKSLGIKGIPSYLIINKDGSKAYDNIAEGGYPGDEIITSELDKALTR
jgi:thiol-disulfide isomerase/thioredoxin